MGCLCWAGATRRPFVTGLCALCRNNGGYVAAERRLFAGPGSGTEAPNIYTGFRLRIMITGGALFTVYYRTREAAELLIDGLAGEGICLDLFRFGPGADEAAPLLSNCNGIQFR